MRTDERSGLVSILVDVASCELGLGWMARFDDENIHLRG